MKRDSFCQKLPSLFSFIRRSAGEEITNFLHVALTVLPMRHMCAIKGHPADSRDEFEPRIQTQISDFISLPVNNECLNSNSLCMLPTLPGSQRPCDNELSWTLTREEILSDTCNHLICRMRR